MTRKKRFLGLLGLVALVAGLLVPMIPAAALVITGELCDVNNPPKYYCSRVQWDPTSSGGTHIYFREHKGGIDGGAQRWQIWYAADWHSDGTQWIRDAFFDEGPWKTNVALEGWFRHGTDNTEYPHNDMAIIQKLRFEESGGGNTWMWCSERLVHYLQRGQDAKEGPGSTLGCDPANK